jgi:hypothetical protein
MAGECELNVGRDSFSGGGFGRVGDGGGWEGCGDWPTAQTQPMA